MKYITLILFIVFLVLTGCEEVIKPDIEIMPDVLVVEGLVTNVDEPYIVKLSKTVGFNNVVTQNPETGAQVLIYDKIGNTYTLEETEQGIYVTKNQFIGEVNSSYMVHIATADGEVYESGYDELLPIAETKDINGRYSENVFLEPNNNGGYNEEQVEGIQIDCDMETKSADGYYRMEYKSVFQIQKTYQLRNSNPVSYFCAFPISSEQTSYINIIDFSQLNSLFVNDFPVVFFGSTFLKWDFPIPDDYDEQNITNISIYSHGLQFQMKLLSLSSDAHNFWEGIFKQIDSSGKIFDPSENQVIGNIKCITNTEKPAFGFFGSSAVEITTGYFYLNSVGNVTKKAIDSFPVIDNIVVDGKPMDFLGYLLLTIKKDYCDIITIKKLRKLRY